MYLVAAIVGNIFTRWTPPGLTLEGELNRMNWLPLLVFLIACDYWLKLTIWTREAVLERWSRCQSRALRTVLGTACLAWASAALWLPASEDVLGSVNGWDGVLAIIGLVILFARDPRPASEAARSVNRTQHRVDAVTSQAR
ncbi:MAG: hypothetical protein ACRDTQ_21600 [Micromonosporaceae bacterium]